MATEKSVTSKNEATWPEAPDATEGELLEPSNGSQVVWGGRNGCESNRRMPSRAEPFEYRQSAILRIGQAMHSDQSRILWHQPRKVHTSRPAIRFPSERLLTSLARRLPPRTCDRSGGRSVITGDKRVEQEFRTARLTHTSRSMAHAAAIAHNASVVPHTTKYSII